MPKDASRLDLTRRSFLKSTLSAAVTIPVIARFAQAEPSALSNLEERSLSFYNLHTSERLKTVYWHRGEYLPSSLVEINRVLRDHRTGDMHDMDPRLLDLLCELRVKLSTTEPLHIISGYRSPQRTPRCTLKATGWPRIVFIWTAWRQTSGFPGKISRYSGRPLCQ
jgi:uncharacterized protein YcbK (DUF882 family)